MKNRKTTNKTGRRRGSQTLVVIPVQNEAGSIGQVVSQIKAVYGFDVVVVDDASRDNSIAESREAGAIVLPLPMKLGAWGAMQTGLRYAHTLGYGYVLTMDGDGQHHCHEIPALMNVFDASPDTDVVVGACTQRGSRLRHIAWRFFRRLTGIGIEDITSGFRLYNREAISVLVGRDATLLDYQDVGVLLLLRAAGLRVRETEVTMAPRCSGKSRVYYSWFAVAYYMLSTTVLSLSKGRSLLAGRSRRFDIEPLEQAL